ncbi:thioredoxin family protein [Thiobacter aerophilum]|uniref:Thioredoxin family protein n=1 Tax=Thiobacter aerophilum TaxID=3121275 RepID=A0ABV0EFY3_9BURK
MLPSLTEFDYHQRLAATPGPALVLFSSPDCGACRVAERLLSHALAGRVTCYKVDVQQATALARAFDLFHLPALFLYRDGHFHAALRSELTAEALRAALDAALASPPQEEP